eukprot:TRINITY_DN6952_c0_g1_i1.p1 TRINITY_DN6952_c0_g1~~TRINITY_DN6952_c0_g1_i1.p1  ORF type:complete len:604 (+),score=87.25 TRINITY_DN6952_c0_g1_i1:58-1869(+)
MGCCGGKPAPKPIASVPVKKERQQIPAEQPIANPPPKEERKPSERTSSPLRKISGNDAPEHTGMSRTGYDRVCTWLLRGKDPPDPTWADPIDVSTLMAPSQQSAHHGKLTMVEVLALETQTTSYENPTFRKCMKDYDLLRTSGEDELCRAIRDLLIEGVLQAHRNNNSQEFMNRIIQLYVGQDPTAVQSCMTAIDLLEKGSFVVADDGLNHYVHRQVGLIQDVWEASRQQELLRRLLKEAARSVSIKMLPKSSEASKAIRTTSGGAGENHLSPTVNQSSHRRRERSNSHSERQQTITIGTPLHTSDTIQKRHLGLSSSGFGSELWIDDPKLNASIGPTVNHLGFEIQTKNRGCPPSRVRLEDQVLVPILTAITTETTLIGCLTADSRDKVIVTLKSTEIMVECESQEQAVFNKNVRIDANTTSNTFTITDDQRSVSLRPKRDSELTAVVALIRVFSALSFEDCSQIMGPTWSEWPTQSKSKNVSILSKCLSWESGDINLSEKSANLLALAAVKAEWQCSAQSLIKEICRRIDISIPSGIQLPNHRSAMSVSRRSSGRYDELDGSPAVSGFGKSFETSWRTNACSFGGSMNNTSVVNTPIVASQ